MTVPPAIEAALKRLASAVDHMEAAAERRGEAEAARGDAAEEFAILRDDRSRLALDLDGALARLRRLEQANDEAARRIDRASAAVLAALGEDGEAAADEASALPDLDEPEEAV